MRLVTIIIFLMTFWIGLMGEAYCVEGIELRVRVFAETHPTQITLTKKNTIQCINLKKYQQGDEVYETSIPHPWYNEYENKGNSNQLVVPYLLVASWGESKEQLYLGIRPLCPNEVNLRMYHKSFECSYATLSDIEALGSDFDSVLRKYFRARYFYNKWRYVNHQPLHVAAIRSARMWYDAAAELVQLSKSVFRMDEEIEHIMKSYENLAKQDKSFEKRFRRYTRNGYINGIDQQLFAANYKFVGKIPFLVKKGHLAEAKKLNALALKAFNSQSETYQKIISMHQGINKDLLVNNSQYIDSLMRIRNNRK